MDANGLKFWMLAEQKQWRMPDHSGVEYDSERRSLRLLSVRQIPEWPGPFPDVTPELESVPQARDQFGNVAWWDAVTHKIIATGTLPGEVEILLPTPLVTDMAVGYDGVLYMASDGRVRMQDLRDRWAAVELEGAEGGEAFVAWRLAADPSGGVWVLDRINRKLARVEGMPFPTRPHGPYTSQTFRPCAENPNPPRLRVLNVTAAMQTGSMVALACGPQGKLAVLSWRNAQGDAEVRLLNEDEELGPPTKLSGIRFPFSMAWVGEDRLALLFDNSLDNKSRVKEAAVYAITEDAVEVSPVGDIYPLRDYAGGPFLHGVTLPPHYPTKRRGASAPLHHLSLPSFATRGQASNRSAFDSGNTQTVWHRLYLDAAIPPQCGIKVFLAATNEEVPPADEWHEHRFGEMFAGRNGDEVPRGAWVSYPSEIPFHEGLLECEPEKDRNGLFTVLIQRAMRRVRTLRGRYLHVRVVLLGNGRATPELAALRAYASRFSYANQYLPELYQETEFGPEADEVGRSTRADFLERFLNIFESVLTPLEDRIAGAYLLTDPRTTREESLEWLGSWIGATFDSAYPPERRRDFLSRAPQLFRQHGTLDGLKLALDVATGGAVSRGQIIVVENFRLRRTFATILGADLADEDDPLLRGLVTSGNSYVGDTLFLGDEEKKAFLALFSADLSVGTDEAAAIRELFESLAYRVTVLVHEDVSREDLGLVRRVVEAETPAHVIAEVATANDDLIVGVASLVGVDTYLSKPQPPEPVRIGARGEASRVGVRDLLLHPPSLDPRLEAGGYDAVRTLGLLPIAKAGPNRTVEFGNSFELDAGASRADKGRSLKKFVWTMLE